MRIVIVAGGGAMLLGFLYVATQTQKRVKLELNIANSSKQINCIKNKGLAAQNLDRAGTV